MSQTFLRYVPVVLALAAAPVLAIACGGDDSTPQTPGDAGADSLPPPPDATRDAPPPVDAGTDAPTTKEAGAPDAAPEAGPTDAGLDALALDASLDAPPGLTVTVAPGGALVYAPSTLNVKVGDTVTWVWAGSNHTVTSGTADTPDNKFCSPNDTSCATAPASNVGATYQHKFTATGTFPYFCRVHGSALMSGTIVVQ